MIKKISINIEDMVYTYPTKNREGFTQEELENLLTWFPTMNRERFDKNMIGNTCLIIEDKIINYQCDVYRALMCAFENRDLTLGEWD